MNAQRATKYFAPQMYLWFMNQVEGSPLLPRDVMTMMLYNRLYVFDLDDGRSLWPMPSIYDVSESLDVIAKVPGQTIVRGQNSWVPVQAPGPQLATRWTIIHDETITTPKPNIDVTGLSGWNEFLLTVINATAANSGTRTAVVAVDGVPNWFTTNGDYRVFAPDGQYFISGGFSFHNGSSTGARGGVIHITGNNSGMFPTGKTENADGAVRHFVASPLPITAIRFRNSVNTNMNAGRFILAAR